MAAEVHYPNLGFCSDVDFFDVIVRSDMSAFNASPGVREGFHLATSLNHMLDWHWHTLNSGVSTKNQLAWSEMRSTMMAVRPALAKVQDLCDASKHCGLDRRNVELAAVNMRLGAGGAGAYNETGRYGIGVTAYGAGRPTLHMLNLDGTVAFWTECFNAAFTHWEALLTTRLSNPSAPNDNLCVTNTVQ